MISKGFSYVNNFEDIKIYFAESLSENKGIKIKKESSEIDFDFMIENKPKNLFEKIIDSIVNIFSKPSNVAIIDKIENNKELEYVKVIVKSQPTRDYGGDNSYRNEYIYSPYSLIFFMRE